MKSLCSVRHASTNCYAATALLIHSYLLFIYGFVNDERSFYLRQRVTVTNLSRDYYWDCYSINLVGDATAEACFVVVVIGLLVEIYLFLM